MLSWCGLTSLCLHENNENLSWLVYFFIIHKIIVRLGYIIPYSRCFSLTPLICRLRFHSFYTLLHFTDLATKIILDLYPCKIVRGHTTPLNKGYRVSQLINSPNGPMTVSAKHWSVLVVMTSIWVKNSPEGISNQTLYSVYPKCFLDSSYSKYYFLYAFYILYPHSLSEH